MRVVIMDKDMAEPLTVVEIPQRLVDHPYVELPVPVSFHEWFTMLDSIQSATQSITMNRVRLKMERIYKHDNGKTRVLFCVGIPDSEELALLLRAAFLPGQMTELRRREVRAWFKGAIGAPEPS